MAEAERLDQVLYSLAEALRVLTLALLPYVPESADKLLDALSEEERGLSEFGSKGGGYTAERIEPLFPKLDPRLEVRLSHRRRARAGGGGARRDLPRHLQAAAAWGLARAAARTSSPASAPTAPSGSAW